MIPKEPSLPRVISFTPGATKYAKIELPGGKYFLLCPPYDRRKAPTPERVNQIGAELVRQYNEHQNEVEGLRKMSPFKRKS